MYLLVNNLLEKAERKKKKQGKRERKERRKGKNRMGIEKNGNSTETLEIGEMNDVISISLFNTTLILFGFRDHTFTPP